MKMKIKKIYYCDYCKKHSLKNIEKHEKHCTANPNRECRLCGRKSINEIIPDYKIEIKQEWFEPSGAISGVTMGEIEKMVKEKMEDLENVVDNCPACILTVIRCNKYKWPVINFGYDYKKKLEEWWEAKNEAENLL